MDLSPAPYVEVHTRPDNGLRAYGHADHRRQVRICYYSLSGHSIKLTPNDLSLNIQINESSTFIREASVLQQMLINIETHNWPKCRELETLECSALNRIFIIHFLFSRLRDHCSRGYMKIVRARKWITKPNSIFWIQQDCCTYELQLL